MGDKEKDKGKGKNKEQFQKADDQAKAKGPDAQLKPVKDCPKPPWKLTVFVKARLSQRKKKLIGPTAEVQWSDGGTDSRLFGLTADDAGETTVIQGTGPHTATCEAKCAGWYTEKTEKVSLNDGDDKKVHLKLIPAPWVAFEVVDEKTGVRIEQLEVKMNLPGPGPRQDTTTKPAPLEYDDLKPGGLYKVLEIAHDAQLWEAVGNVTSA